MRKWNLTHFNRELERPRFNIRQELIWDQPGPNKQIKGKQMTSVWLDVWRDQCISGQEEMEALHSLVDMKGIQWYLSVKKGTHHPILFLERHFSFNKFNHCGKQGWEFVVVPRLLVVVLFRRRLYHPYWSFCFFMVRAALMVLVQHFEAVLTVSGPFLS